MKYNWKRYWVPHGTAISLADDGYLLVPSDRWTKHINPGLVTLDSLHDHPCLILLGEPGIGKSKTLESERNEIEKVVADNDDTLLWKDLRSYESEDRLVKDIFETDKFKEWEGEQNNLYLFLDSFDECRLAIPKLSQLFGDKFRDIAKDSIKRLKLRIACRTAVWPKLLEDTLKDLYNYKKDNEGHNVKALELAPLTKINVILAAETNKIVAVEFLEEVKRHNAAPLAIKPITLNFLIGLYNRNQSFPSNKTELYKQGLMLLVAEENPSRKESSLTGDLSVTQRLLVAARIAAVTIFCNKSEIKKSDDYDGLPSEELSIGNLSGGKEKFNNEEIKITDESIKEVIDSGLFTARGDTYFGWMHQTFAEYLAAFYIQNKNLNLSQINDLLRSHIDSSDKLHPQLYETAAWLSNMRPDLFREISKTDPDVLIRTNTLAPDNEDKKVLIKNLLSLYGKEELPLEYFDFKQNKNNWYFDGLEDVIKPFLTDKTKNEAARIVALRLLKCMDKTSLQGELLAIINDTSEPSYIRTQAIEAFGLFADREQLRCLKSILRGDISGDEDDSIRAEILKLLWPSIINGEELFEALTKPQKSLFFGQYHGFLNYVLLNTLKPENLQCALNWLSKQTIVNSYDFPFRRLNDAIILLAFKNLANNDICNLLLDLTFTRSKAYNHITFEKEDSFKVNLSKNAENRRDWLCNVVKYKSSSTDKRDYYLIGQIISVLDEDIPWLIEKLKTVTDQSRKTLWSKIISWAFNYHDSEYNDLIIKTSWDSEQLKEEMSYCLEFVEFGSEKEKNMKLILDWKNKEEPEPVSVEDRLEKIFEEARSSLKKCEDGDPLEWWRFVVSMGHSSSDNYLVLDETELDLTASCFWQRFDEKSKERILKAAKEYLVIASVPEKLDHIARAGYKAIRLLMDYVPEEAKHLAPDVWGKWTQYIVSIPNILGERTAEKHVAVSKMAYQKAPNVFIKSLKAVIKEQNQNDSHISVHEQIASFLDDILTSTLIEMLDYTCARHQSWDDILSFLFDNERNEVYVYCEEQLKNLAAKNRPDNEKAHGAAFHLIMHSPSKYWNPVWKAVSSDDMSARKVIERLANHLSYKSGSFYKSINDEQTASLFIWLVKRYPYEKDPIHDKGAYTPDTRDHIVQVKSYLLNRLEQAGNIDALSQIDRIIAELPELPWLKRVLIRARYEAYRKSWVPPTPKEFLILTETSSIRYIQSEEQLLVVVMNTLRQIEYKMHRSSLGARPLWNEQKKGRKPVYTPKDEGNLSNYLKDELEKYLSTRVIINREVEIKRRYKSDIKVDAHLKNENGEIIDTATVIIEAKGCWHKEVKTAMETQLAGRYLKENDYKYGIYLVGWFLCDLWGDEDYRKTDTPKWDINQAQEYFNKQAEDLSTNIKISAFVMDTSLQ